MNFFWDNIFRLSKKDDSIRAAIGQNILFKSLTASELKFVQAILHVRHYHAGEPVFKQFDVGVGMYIIVKGRIEIFIQDDSDPRGKEQEIFITQLLSGDFFGEIALVEEHGRRTASAIAREESVLVGFFKPDLMEILKRSPTTGIKILSNLSEVLGKRLSETTEKVSDLRRAIRDLRQPPPIESKNHES